MHISHAVPNWLLAWVCMCSVKCLLAFIRCLTFVSIRLGPNSMCIHVLCVVCVLCSSHSISGVPTAPVHTCAYHCLITFDNSLWQLRLKGILLFRIHFGSRPESTCATQAQRCSCTNQECMIVAKLWKVKHVATHRANDSYKHPWPWVQLWHQAHITDRPFQGGEVSLRAAT